MQLAGIWCKEYIFKQPYELYWSQETHYVKQNTDLYLIPKKTLHLQIVCKDLHEKFHTDYKPCMQTGNDLSL